MVVSFFSEDTYTKQDTIDNQDVTLKIMDTYDKVRNFPMFIN